MVRGRSLGVPATDFRSFLTGKSSASSRFLRREDPPAVRFSCPYRASRARPALALQSLRSFHSLQSFRARPRAGIRYGVGVA